MWYTYNLISLRDLTLYTGFTDDIKRRLDEHNTKRGGEYTKRHAPFKLMHYEAFLSKEEAMMQEKFYKSGYGREVLKEKIKKSLEEIENHSGESSNGRTPAFEAANDGSIPSSPV